MLQREDVVEVCMITCWMLWYNWNKCLYEHVCKIPDAIVVSVQMLYEDYKSMNQRENVRHIQEQEQWKPPPNDVLKINTDAGFVESLNEAMLGVVARDSVGYVWFCAATRKRNIHPHL